MTRIAIILVLLLGSGAQAAAQTLPGAFAIPSGRYEYRSRLLRKPDGSFERTPARGYLRLERDGRFSHRREDPGLLLSREAGRYGARGNVLYVRRVIPTDGSTQTDTFVVRTVGDRLFLWQNLHERGQVDYELALEGAPAARTLPPGVAPGLFGYVAEILYSAVDDWPDPDRRGRVFAKTFPSASTRFLVLQFQLEYPMTTAARTMALDCRILRSSGEQVYQNVIPIQIAAGSASSYPWFRWGREQPGSIAPDTYRVRCTLDGAQMMEGTFQVT